MNGSLFGPFIQYIHCLISFIYTVVICAIFKVYLLMVCAILIYPGSILVHIQKVMVYT